MCHYQIDYAKTGRARCKACKQPIDQASLRLGKLTDAGQYQQVAWHHIACIAKQRSSKDLDPTDFKGWDDVTDADKQTVLASFHRNNAEKSTKSSQKQMVFDPESGTTRPDPNVKPKKKPLLLEPVPAKKQNLGGNNEGRDFNSLVDEAESVFNAVIKGKKVKDIDPEAGYTKKKGLSPAQNEQFLALCQEFDHKKGEELRDLLRQNHEKVSGNKKTLVERCAEGKLLGVLPLCRTCNRGHMHLDWKRRMYVCEGYMDHGRREVCEGAMDKDEVQRKDWVD